MDADRLEQPLVDVPRPETRPVRQHWSVRARDALLTYVPLLLMLALAGATWWLVRVTPLPPAPAATTAPATGPDYVLNGVDLTRYGADGQAKARLRGVELRHYAADDRMELDAADIEVQAPDGAWRLQARRATLRDQGDRLELAGDVWVRRLPTATAAGFDIRGEAIELETRTGAARSAEPVEWRQDDTVVRAAGFTYRPEAPGVTPGVEWQGPVRAEWLPAATRPR